MHPLVKDPQVARLSVFLHGLAERHAVVGLRLLAADVQQARQAVLMQFQDALDGAVAGLAIAGALADAEAEQFGGERHDRRVDEAQAQGFGFAGRGLGSQLPVQMGVEGGEVVRRDGGEALPEGAVVRCVARLGLEDPLVEVFEQAQGQVGVVEQAVEQADKDGAAGEPDLVLGVHFVFQSETIQQVRGQQRQQNFDANHAL